MRLRPIAFARARHCAAANTLAAATPAWRRPRWRKLICEADQRRE